MKRTKLLLLGSGELGKEFVIESKRLGCEVIAVDKYHNAPAMQLADDSYVIDMSNKNSLKNIIRKIKPDFVVPEIEALSIEALYDMELEGFKIVPNARTVEITMNRDKIRDLATSQLNINTAKYKYVFNVEELKEAARLVGYPLLLKPLMSSSGKGQNLVVKENYILDAWENALANSRGNVKGVILEEFINFDYEFTLLTVRNNHGENIFCPPIGHEQVNGDYQCSWQPLDLPSSLFEEAKVIATKILDNLNGAGIFGVEFFVIGERLIFSELSPRPHDTGLVTLIGQNISEFELHLRAILDLPIPPVHVIRPSASHVILSKDYYECFEYGGLKEALNIESTKVLIFGKPIAKKGRRMGVALASAKDTLQARRRADKCASHVNIYSIEI